jgi:TonB family protein
MEALLVYFMKVNIAIAALDLFFRLLFHRDTFFREKRWALLIGWAFAMLHPLMDVSIWVESSQTVKVAAQTLSTTLPDIVITPKNTSMLNDERILPFLYFMVTAFFLLRILIQSSSVLLKTAYAPKHHRNGLTIIITPKGTSPFSFFGWVFLNPTDYSDSDLEEILHHESVHIRQGHTFDVLLTEILCALFWINPFAWLLKRQLRQNLEFLADSDVLHSGFDPKSYQYHLLRLSYQQPTSNMGNHFNVTELKNRIIMMNKKKTSMAGLGKYTLALPLFAFVWLATYAWGSKSETMLTNETVQAQSASEKEKKEISPAKDADKNSKEKTFYTVEQMPQYPGGEQMLMNFVMDNLHYPADAIEKKVEGRVIIRFVISETGDITNVDVIKSLNPACDAEAVRVVRMMPKWEPGVQKGKKVPVYFTLPIVYKLKGDDNKSVNIRLSGEGSEPLLVVDGVVKPYSVMSDTCQLQPADIKAISILKDSSAVAIYGEKGRNGVVIITKKKK